jgi:hypothetical protein
MDSFRNEIVSGSKPIVGACSFTKGGRSGCFTHDKGSLPVGQNGINSLEDCASWCNDCPRCGYISFSAALRDCSWFVECRMHTLLTISGGEKFVTLRIRRGEVATLSPPPPPPPWRALKVEAAAAVRLSGHLGPYCALEALEKQVNGLQAAMCTCTRGARSDRGPLTGAQRLETLGTMSPAPPACVSYALVSGPG